MQSWFSSFPEYTCSPPIVPPPTVEIGMKPLVLPPRKTNQTIYEYRYEILRALKFDETAADLLAAQHAINLIDVNAVLSKGCSHELAVRIFL